MKIPKLLWAIIGLSILINIIAIVIAINSPNGNSYPSQNTQTAPVVDYTKIQQFIKDQFSAIHTPADGKDGQTIQGPKGDSGADGQKGDPGTQGEQGANGNDGQPGADGKSIEMRYNLSKGQIEYRYEGDFSWKTLVSACTLTNSCGAL